MAIIPKYTRQVTPTTVEVPRLTLPQPVEGAFGANIGRAYQGLGNQIADTAQVLNQYRVKKYKEEQDKLETQNIDKYERYRTDLFYNGDNEEVDDNGYKYDRPKGLLNRTLASSSGSTLEYQKKMDEYIAESLATIGDEKTRQRVKDRLDAYSRNDRDIIARHEATQTKQDKINVQKAGVEGALNNAYSAQSNQDIRIQIDNAVEAQKKLHSIVGVSRESSEAGLRDVRAQVIENAILGNLELDKTATTSRTFLNEFKDEIPVERRKNIEKKIDAVLKQNAIKKEDEFLSKFITGELSANEVMSESRPIEEGGIGVDKAKGLLDKLKKVQEKDLSVITNKGRHKGWMEYINLANVMLEDQVDNYNAKQLLVNAMADGGLNNEEASQLKIVKEAMQKIKGTATDGKVKNAYRAISRTFKLPTKTGDTKELKEALSTFINEAILQNKNFDGVKAEEISANIIENEKNRKYPDRVIYSGLKNYVDERGVSYSIVGESPDGELMVEVNMKDNQNAQ